MACRSEDDRSFDRSSGHPKAAMLNRSSTFHPHHHQKSSPPLSPTEFTKKPPLERSASLKRHDSGGSSLKGKVKKLCSIFEKTKTPPSSQNLQPLPPKAVNHDSSLNSYPLRLPGTVDRVVIYFTSLRGIRRTYTDCYAVRMIFKGFRVNLDERDISMDSAYKKELQCIVGEKKTVTLPQVFIKGRHIGGADAVKQLNETGELRKILTGLPVRASKPGMGYVCEGCGDARFIPCSTCSGSRKVFDDDAGQPKRCLECNENGLVRCPGCCF